MEKQESIFHLGESQGILLSLEKSGKSVKKKKIQNTGKIRENYTGKLKKILEKSGNPATQFISSCISQHGLLNLSNLGLLLQVPVSIAHDHECRFYFKHKWVLYLLELKSMATKFSASTLAQVENSLSVQAWSRLKNLILYIKIKVR